LNSVDLPTFGRPNDRYDRFHVCSTVRASAPESQQRDGTALRLDHDAVGPLLGPGDDGAVADLGARQELAVSGARKCT